MFAIRGIARWLRRATEPGAGPSRVRLDRFVAGAAASTPPGALVLDAGAGDSPLRHHFAHCRYESADFLAVEKAYANDITYECDLSAIPVEDGRFSLVLLTQVLEHLPEPSPVLAEMHRVLEPGGQIWASCPFYYEEHEQPYDFYRYTQFSLDRLFREAGFAGIRIDWLEGYLATVGYQLDVAARALPRRRRVPRAVLRLAAIACNRAELRRKVTSAGHPKNYTIIARA